MGKYYIGLDGGSTYLKAALIGNGRVMDTMVRSTGIDNNGTAKKIAAELCKRNTLSPSDIGYIMATGYSRKNLEVADDDQFSLRGIDDAVVGDCAIDRGMIAYDGDRAGVDDRGALQGTVCIEVDRAARCVRDRAGGGQNPVFVQIELAEVSEALNREDDRAFRRDIAGIVERVGGNGRADDLSVAVVFQVTDREIGGV